MNASTNAAPQLEDDTRSRLIQAAIRLFGQRGYDGVSTRALAEAADANISAIKYHFGDKAGLYRASLEFCIDGVQQKIKPLLASFHTGIESAKGDRATLINLVRHFILNWAQSLLTDDEMQPRLALFIREYMAPSDFFSTIYEGIPKIILEAFSKIIAIIDDIDPDDPRVGIRAQILAGQFFIFLIGRPVLLKNMGWQKVPPEGVALIADEIADAMICVLFNRDMDSNARNTRRRRA